MWSNTRDLIQNSLNNFGQIFRRYGTSSSIDLDFRRRTILRPRRTNRTNCLSRNSNRASTINSQLNRALLSSSSQPLRPPHLHSCQSNSSSFSSHGSQHTCFTPLPAETINPSPNNSTPSNQSPNLPNRSLSPILPVVANSRFPIISCPPTNSNVFSQHYLRSISRSFCNPSNNLTGDLRPLQLTGTGQKNYLSCLTNGLVIVTIVIAILQPKWFSIAGGVCNNRYIRLQEFMFVQSPPVIKNPFASSFNSPSRDTRHHSLHITPEPTNYHDLGPKKVNYFKLTEDTDRKLATKLNSTHLDTNSTDSTSTYLLTTHPPIHLPLSEPEKERTHLLYKSYEKVKKSIASDETSQIQFYKSMADHYQTNQAATNDCLSPEVLSLQRLIIILCIFVIFSTLIQLLLDLIGTNNKYINLLRGHAIFNIIAVLICTIIVGISYQLSNLLSKEQTQKHMLMNGSNRFYNYPNNHFLDKAKLHSSINYFNLDKDENRIEVRLEISYYLIIFAGIGSLIASFLECNLFFSKPNLYLININSDQETSNLLNDDSQAGYWSHLFNVNNNNPNLRNIANFPHIYLPPPPYTP